MSSCQGCGGPLPPRARKWCSERCRKGSYGDPCVDCGARTVYGAETKRVPEPRCVPCENARRTVWTQEIIIDRIREWVALYDTPPAMPDWNPVQARIINDPERARRFYAAEGHWPWFMRVIERFGSWNAGVAAAGFEPRKRGGNRRRKAVA